MVLGLIRCLGGQLWIKWLPDERGNNAVRSMGSQGEAKAGKLHELSRYAVQVNAAFHMHGTEL